MEITLDYTPQPRQMLLHTATAKEILYGGAAGGGKSHALRWDGIDILLNCPGIMGVMFRRTLPQLYQNHVLAVRAAIPPELGRWNETHKRFEFHNGSVMIFKHLEHEFDVEDIQGWEIHWAGVDEAGQFTPYQLNYIMSRMRLGSHEERLRKLVEEQPRLAAYIDKLPRLAMSANPGGISHHWLKHNFISPAPPETVFEKRMTDPFGREAVRTRMFIPATMLDNRYLDANYAAQFEDLPEHMKKQLVEGDWDVVPGAFFDCWSTHHHVIRPFTIPEHWTRIMSLDWGSATPFSVGWWAISDGSEVTNSAGRIVQYPRGAMIRYREWYGAQQKDGLYTTKGLRMSGDAVARGILERETRPDGSREKIAIRVADPSMWRAERGMSQAELLIRGGVGIVRADNQRESGWQEMYRRLSHETGEPMMYVFETCREFIRQIPAVEADEKRPEDITQRNRGGEDHIADETRYACMARPMVRDAEPEPEPMDRPLRFRDLLDEHQRLAAARRMQGGQRKRI